ncbi:hypothetical protein [Nocardia nova]|jgi:hypothetical protein|uniref:hypothetical protein n=1 Tax=Nocardia nova TaxID=37330 RepID=UPI00189499AB|nr:hypothetical protein [Nocardia nova]MBF6277060.1 hypothetical protein [Nocardia nova]
MTTSMIVRTAIPELDAITHLGFAIQHSHNHASIAAIQEAVAVVSDKAREKGATDEDLLDCYQAGLRGHTHVDSDRDEVIAGTHLAKAFIYVDDSRLMAAIGVAGNPVWAAISAVR